MLSHSSSLLFRRDNPYGIFNIYMFLSLSFYIGTLQIYIVTFPEIRSELRGILHDYQ